MKKLLNILIVLFIFILVVEINFNYSFAGASHIDIDGEMVDDEEEFVKEREQKQEEIQNQEQSKDLERYIRREQDKNIENAIKDADQFLSNGKFGNSYTSGFDDIQANLDVIFNILVIVGTVLTVIVGGILGINFMIASAEDKAKIKEALIPYILGCIVIFGAFGIWKLTVAIGNSMADLPNPQVDGTTITEDGFSHSSGKY